VIDDNACKREREDLILALPEATIRERLQVLFNAALKLIAALDRVAKLRCAQVSKKTYLYAKRGLPRLSYLMYAFACQKRPTHITKETYYMAKEAYHMVKEAYYMAK
jgi:predicted metalloprotease with PDZ domain